MGEKTLSVPALSFLLPQRAYSVNMLPFGKFHSIGGAPPDTFPNVKYDTPEEVGGDRKCFDSLIRK